MKKRNDPGLEFMKELGFKPSNSFKAFGNELSLKFGKEYAEEIVHFFEVRVNNDKSEGAGLYSLKNRDFETSMTISGLYDSDYYRTACNWIMDNSEHIKGNILDVGCDNGILTCFIASRFPDCMIVGIDKEIGSITIARQLAEKLNLDNVSFVSSSIEKYCGRFDVVFSSRTVIENRTESVIEPAVYGYTKSLKEVIFEYKDVFDKYSNTLKNLLKENGIIIELERMQNNQLLVGWQLSMNCNGFSQINVPSFITANEGGTDSCFTGLLFRKNEDNLDDQIIIDEWMKGIIDSSKIVEKRLYGTEAQAMLEYYHYEQDAGLILRQSDNDPNRNISISSGWLYCPDRIYVQYTINYDNDSDSRYRVLYFTSENEREQSLKDVENWKVFAKKNGYTVEKHYFGDTSR